MGIKRDKADAAFSKYIRTRDNFTCQRCGAVHKENSKGLHCSHHFGRWKENTRFDPDNCDALCHGCHVYFTSNPLFYVEWKKKKMGYDAYVALAVASSTYKKKDRKMEYIKAKILLSEIERG